MYGFIFKFTEMRKKSILLLKKHFDHLLELREEVYYKIEPFFTTQTYTKGRIIQKPGEIDDKARFICLGQVAKMWPTKKKGRDHKVMEFGPGKVASVFESYFSQQPTDFYLKAVTYVSTLELDHEVEKNLLKEVPEVAELASYINRQILMETLQWHYAFYFDQEEGYRVFKKNFPLYTNYFSNKDLGFLFNCSEQKISEIKQKVLI